MRTLLIGLDAACQSVLDRVFETDSAPTLASLFDEGTSGDLTSQVPPWTPSAWPSLYTGVNPGKHGVFGFLTFDGYDWDVVNATDVRERTLWELLDHHGMRSVVVNAPVTHPPPSIDGAVVPGYIAPEDAECHPPGLLADVRDEVGEYRIYADRERKNAGQAERLAAYDDLTRMRGRAFRYLADRFDPEFGFVQFQQTDTVFHECPGDWEAVCSVYRTVDEEIRAILDECDPDVVVVASDHGIGEYDGYGFRVNDYLHEHGFAETRQGDGGMPSWGMAGRKLQQGEDVSTESASDDSPGAVESALSAAGRVGLTSQRIGAILGRLGLRDAVLEHVPMQMVRAASESVDFRNSLAFMRSRIELGVRINLAGREPDGVVPPERYEDVRADVVDRLESATTPDGIPVFSTVVPREEVYHGPYVESAPDVVFVPTDYDHYLSADIRGESFAAEPRESWNHKRQGIVALAGDEVDTAAAIGDAHLFDVAPTVLASLGLPAGSHMDGRALSPVDPPGVTSYPEYDAGETAATEDDAVEQHLSDLGYLE